MAVIREGLRVKETTATTGTGTISLAGAITQYQSFSNIANIVSGDFVRYVLLDGNGTAWERGLGTFTSGSPNTLARTFVFESTNSNNAIGLSSNTHTIFNSSTISQSVNPTQGFKNRIINGDMRIDQRNSGSSQTFTAGAALAYCVDRFYGYCTGANITGQQVAAADNTLRYTFTGAASNTAVGFGQRIEAKSVLDLNGINATFQVLLYSSSLTSITWAAYYANTSDTFGTLASPTRTQIATGTFTINSTEANYIANFAVATSTGIEIVLTGGALLASQTLTIGRVSLEAGDNATIFEQRSYGSELNLCLRYFYQYTGAAEYLQANGFTNSVACTIRMPVYMRVAPSVTTTLTNANYNSSGGANTWYMILALVAIATKSGTAAISFSSNNGTVTVNIGGMTFSTSTNALTITGLSILCLAEL